MISQFPLDDQIVCFDNQSERFHIANQVGARILELHVKGLAQEEICNTLYEEFDANQELISTDVRTFIQHWESDNVTQFRPRQTHTPDTQYVPHRPLICSSDMVFHLPNGSVTIRCESAAVIDLLRPMFCLSEAVVQTARKLSVEIFKEGDHYPIVFDGRTLDTGYTVEHAAVLCLRAINILVSQIESHALTFHAAAIALGDNGALLAAMGGSGKTTLTAYLVAHGYQLINDDAVHLSEEPIKMVPIPVAMNIKAGSWNILTQWYPHMLQHKVYGYSAEREQRYLPPADAQVAVKPITCKVVCFPHYRAGASTTLLPVSRATALASLISSGCYMPSPIEAPQIERLVNWIQSLDFYTLEYSCVKEAEAVLRQFLGE